MTEARSVSGNLVRLHAAPDEPSVNRSLTGPPGSPIPKRHDHDLGRRLSRSTVLVSVGRPESGRAADVSATRRWPSAGEVLSAFHPSPRSIQDSRCNRDRPAKGAASRSPHLRRRQRLVRSGPGSVPQLTADEFDSRADPSWLRARQRTRYRRPVRAARRGPRSCPGLRSSLTIALACWVSSQFESAMFRTLFRV